MIDIIVNNRDERFRPTGIVKEILDKRIRNFPRNHVRIRRRVVKKIKPPLNKQLKLVFELNEKTDTDFYFQD